MCEDLPRKRKSAQDVRVAVKSEREPAGPSGRPAGRFFRRCPGGLSAAAAPTATAKRGRRPRGRVSSTRRIPKLRAESQQIAAWKLLYRVQHPAKYVSRLQTIPSSDVEPYSTRDRPPEAGRRGARDPAAVPTPRAAMGPVRRPPRTATA